MPDTSALIFASVVFDNGAKVLRGVTTAVAAYTVLVIFLGLTNERDRR